MLRRQRDWRFAVLCLMLGLMAMRQALTLHGELVAAEGAPWQHLATFGVWSELPGLVVSFLAFGAVLIVGRMLAERDATVAAFARRERQFRSACRSASMGTFVVDLERGQMQLSPELTQMFGWTTTDEVSLARFREHLHADDVSDFDRCGEALRAGGRDLCDRLVRVRGPSGAFRHVQMIGEVQRAGEDGPSLQGVMIDVSQQVRLRAEIEALAVGESQTRTRRERLEHLVASLARALGADLAFVGELVGDGDRVQTLAMVSDGRLIDNLTYELGDTPCAGVIQGGVCVVPDRVCERYPRDALLQRVGMNGYAGKSLLDANGDEVGIVVVLTRGTFADSQFLRTLLHVYSIRLANELARGRDEDRLHLTRFALDHAGDGVFLLDERAQIVDVNESALRRFGYTQDELLQSTMADIDAEHSQAEWRQVLARVRDSGGLSLESTHRRRDGSEFPVEIVVTPLAYQGADHFCAVARDVTERRQAERDRARLEAELRQAQKMEAIGTFAGGIAHDFNNLLTAVYGNVDLARAELDDADAVAESLDAILRVARQGEAMTRRLLTFAHKAPAEKRPLDLGRLVLDTAAMLRRLQPAAIEVRADVPADRTAMVHGDESQLQQVLMNLAVNAQQAMPNGGELTLALRTDGCDGAGGDAAGKAVLSVLDTGVGMDEETIERAFEPFFTTKARGDGTGLGLSVVHGIVTEHGGNVGLRSQPGVGSCFSIELPLLPAAAGGGIGDADGQGAFPARPAGGAAAKGTVLVAEDNEPVRRLVASSLAAAGYGVVDVADGEQALRAFEAEPGRFQMALLDMDMPRMSGEQCCAELRRLRPDLPLVMMTGNAELLEDARVRLRLAVLAKPFQVRRLLAIVEQACAKEPR